MEYEEMQMIWNNQNNEKLYTINENALYTQIKRKGQSIDGKLTIFELIMIGVNLIVGIVLIVDAVRGNELAVQYTLPAMYLIYFVYAVVRRVTRRKETAHFDLTILGELEKAIWQIDYLIRQSRSMILWYLLPLMVVFSVIAFFEAKLLWAFGTMIIVIPLTYFGSRWEINKFYMPKKRELEDLCKKLLAPQLQS